MKKVKDKLFGQQSEDANNLKNILNNSASIGIISDYLLNENNKLRNLVFTTEYMRKLYESFNDVVLVDTTFGTNRFKMPLLVISGINNEGQNILFGFSLLENETRETFNWVFEKFFREIMKFPPRFIITDGCKSMIQSIK